MAYHTLKTDALDLLIFSRMMLQSRLTQKAIASGLTATGLIFALISGGMNLKLALAILLLLLGTVLNYRTPAKPVIWAFYMIAGSAFTTTFFVTGEAWATHIVGMVLLFPFALLIFNGSTLDDVVKWTLPFAFLHSALVIWQGITGDSRATGLTTNPNYAAGFLVVIAVWLLAAKHPWYAAPLALALFFTGSRLGASVFTLMVLLFIIHQKNIFILPFLLIIIVLPSRPELIYDIGFRLRDLSWPGLWGSGWWSQSVHNVPIKMALEWGIFASLAWIAITAWSIAKRPFNFDGNMAVLAALVGLSILDFYTFSPIMSGWWWLAVSQRSYLRG